MTNLHTTEHGNPDAASTVVLLSSIGTTHETWRAQIPELAKTHRVVTVDHRGHGASETPATSPQGVADLGRDVLAALDAAGVDRFKVVGLSLGGAIAQWLAAHSGRVDKAVFCATATFLGGEEKWAEKTTTAREEGTQALADGMMQNWFTDDFRSQHADVVEWVREMVCSIDDEGYAQNGDALATWDFEGDLAQITCPVLTIAGASDPSTGPDELAKIAAGVSGPVESEVIDPGSHQVAVENPEAVNLALTRFLGE
ncbi:alpha/beta fold hydrolase [Corynebacterium sp. Marseille-P4321]|uniref:alpha/beta fold hydrolase n=1 Tax=Corynebacterium sp. Marseille-P4321 TaxID=2736603 RepID=UPI0020CA534F|nr:alpha/beta fold hydrolase [Corynebacterium sp. Marseille-P4321]